MQHNEAADGEFAEHGDCCQNHEGEEEYGVQHQSRSDFGENAARRHESEHNTKHKQNAAEKAQPSQHLKRALGQFHQVVHVVLPQFPECPARLAVLARMVGDGHLGVASGFGNGIHITKHMEGAEVKRTQQGGVVYFEGAAEIGQGASGSAAHNHVCQFRRQDTKHGILAIFSVAADQVVALIVFGNEQGQIVWVQL